MSLVQSEGESFRKVVDYSQTIPPSLIGHYPEFLLKVKELYKYNLKIIKLYLNDAKIFIEQYYMQNQNDINYHNWFLYEQFLYALERSCQFILNDKWLDKYLLHPFTIL